jgi:hypothetical protein
MCSGNVVSSRSANVDRRVTDIKYSMVIYEKGKLERSLS